jgi:hypothetical protein
MTDTLILLAHGAGAGQSHPFMQAWATALSRQFDVVPFEYDYMRREGRRPPDRLPKLLSRHEAELASARALFPGRKTILVGKSMGSRVGCHLANSLPAGDAVDALVCLGYPLKGRSTLRDEVLRQLATPVLFVQGSRDPLCPLPLLEDVRPQIQSRNEVHVVAGGDHSLKVRKKDLQEAESSQLEVDKTAMARVREFILTIEAR